MAYEALILGTPYGINRAVGIAKGRFSHNENRVPAVRPKRAPSDSDGASEAD
jgi:hypothetical protein